MESAIEVHRSLGPGLLESVYEICLCKELDLRNIRYRRQSPVELNYKGEVVKMKLIIDLIVEDKIIAELKSVEKTIPVYSSQLLSHLRLTKKKLGLLINFNVPVLVEEFKKNNKLIINKFFNKLRDPDHIKLNTTLCDSVSLC
ncbi:MAG: GxxExxY protein [bacterium]